MNITPNLPTSDGFDEMLSEGVSTSDEAAQAAGQLSKMDSLTESSTFWAGKAAYNKFETYNQGAAKAPMKALRAQYPEFSDIFNQDEHPAMAEMMVEREGKRRVLEAKVAQGPKGFWQGTKEFGYGAGAMLTDPMEATLNIGSMLLTGGLSALGQLGAKAIGRAVAPVAARSLGRSLALGAAENAALTAVSEASAGAAALSGGREYSAADFGTNVGISTVVGGGMQLGFYGLGKAIRPVEKAVPDRVAPSGEPGRISVPPDAEPSPALAVDQKQVARDYTKVANRQTDITNQLKMEKDPARILELEKLSEELQLEADRLVELRQGSAEPGIKYVQNPPNDARLGGVPDAVVEKMHQKTDAALSEGRLVDHTAERTHLVKETFNDGGGRYEFKPLSGTPSDPNFSGTIRAVHGTSQDLTKFSDPSQLPSETRYDGDGGAFGPNTYFDTTGDWTGSDGRYNIGGARGVAFKNVVGGEVTFKKALVISPETLANAKGIVGDEFSFELTPKLKEQGYDGIVVRGMDALEKKLNTKMEKKYPILKETLNEGWSQAKSEEWARAYQAREDYLKEKTNGFLGDAFTPWQDQTVSFNPENSSAITHKFKSRPTVKEVQDFIGKTRSYTDDRPLYGASEVASDSLHDAPTAHMGDYMGEDVISLTDNRYATESIAARGTGDSPGSQYRAELDPSTKLLNLGDEDILAETFKDRYLAARETNDVAEFARINEDLRASGYDGVIHSGGEYLGGEAPRQNQITIWNKEKVLQREHIPGDASKQVTANEQEIRAELESQADHKNRIDYNAESVKHLDQVEAAPKTKNDLAEARENLSSIDEDIKGAVERGEITPEELQDIADEIAKERGDFKQREMAFKAYTNCKGSQ